MLAAACAGRTGQTGGAISALEPIEAWTVDLGSGQGHAILFRNNRRDPVRITSITLLQCQNTSPSCRTIDPRITVDPGQTREAITIRPQNRNEAFAFTYTYRYAWVVSAAAVNQPIAAEAPAPGMLTVAQARGLGARWRGLRVEPESLVMRIGDTVDMATLRVLAVDSAGGALGRLQVYDRSLTPGAALLTGYSRITAIGHGVGLLIIRPQGAMWDAARPRPAVHVRIVVR